MRKYRSRPIRTLVAIHCDVCDKSCQHPEFLGDNVVNENDFEVATLSAVWGYGSRKDGEKHCIDLCEDCFDDVVKYIQDRTTQKREQQNNEQRND